MTISAPTLGLALGWLLVGWACLRGLLAAAKIVLGRARANRAYAAERADFCRRVTATAQAARAAKAIADWDGWRSFRVAAVIDEARDVKSFYFTPDDGQPLSPFAPGQYLTFRLPISAGGPPLVRCYSLSDRPRHDYYRATIKRVAAPAGKPGLAPGRGSGYFHDSVQVGDVLDVRAPAGTFLIDPRAMEPIVLVGAGIGITPLVSMLEAIVEAGEPREIHVLFGFRNGSEHPFKERVATIAAEHPHIRLHVSYSSPTASDTLYRDYNHRGRVTFERVRQVLPSNNFRFYVCGPGQLMESLVPALWQWGVPESHVHFEAFGPASVKSAQAGAGGAGQSYTVEFGRSQRTLTWNGAHPSLLDFGEAAGVVMASGCRAGSCGECLVAMRDGAVAPLKQPGIAVPDGHCLPCISVPTAPLVLDA